MEQNEIPKKQKKFLKIESSASKNNLNKEKEKFFEEQWRPKFPKEKGSFPEEHYTSLRSNGPFPKK